MAFSSSTAAMLNFDHLYNLPPLQESPPSCIPPLFDRLPPLEPRPSEVGDRSSATRSDVLTSRQRALAQAKPLDGSLQTESEEPIVSEQHDHAEGALPAKPRVPNPEQARKRTKLRHNEQIADFVHLPKLQKSRPKIEKIPPFQPIAIVNQLNEPPPSASLLPPITTSGAHQEDIQEQDKSNSRGDSGNKQRKADSYTIEPSGTIPKSKATVHREPKKKIYLRNRVRWTDEETEHLVKGVTIYGMGRWKHILEHPEFKFHPARTHVDLKDKFRVIFPPNAPHKWVRSMPEHISDEEGEDDASQQKAANKPHLRARRRAWSAEEDQALDEGFPRHGYKWEMMAKDPKLHFDKRTGAQIRDRFRLRYPELYAAQSKSTVDSSIPVMAAVTPSEDESIGDEDPPQLRQDPIEARIKTPEGKKDRNQPPMSERIVQMDSKDSTSRDQTNGESNANTRLTNITVNAAPTTAILTSETNHDTLFDEILNMPDIPKDPATVLPSLTSATLNTTFTPATTSHSHPPPLPTPNVVTPIQSGPEWLTYLLNSESAAAAAAAANGENGDPSETPPLSSELSQYEDWNDESLGIGADHVDVDGEVVGIGSGLTLPPLLNWEDMVPGSMFDMG